MLWEEVSDFIYLDLDPNPDAEMVMERIPKPRGSSNVSHPVETPVILFKGPLFNRVIPATNLSSFPNIFHLTQPQKNVGSLRCVHTDSPINLY